MALSGLLLAGLILCGLVLLVVVVGGLIGVLIKLGVIAREAQRPPHLDTGTYDLKQGREVVSEDRRDHNA